MSNSIKSAYAASKNIYDDTLTQTTWWARLYIRFFWSGVQDLEIAKEVLRFIPDDFSGKLLDIPAGTGVFTANKYKTLQKAEIVCVDYSEDMLAQARERFSANNIHNARCMQGDVGALEFADESFDTVLSMNGFHAFPDKEKAFSETARVLKKGGVFCGCFYIKKQSRRTDFLVNRVLAKKGWFTPPFQSLEELKLTLQKSYQKVDIQNQAAMVYFKCIK